MRFGVTIEQLADVELAYPKFTAVGDQTSIVPACQHKRFSSKSPSRIHRAASFPSGSSDTGLGRSSSLTELVGTIQLIHRGTHENKRVSMISALGVTGQGFAPGVR